MFERILYPTDFSDVSKKALNYIKQLKEAGSKEVLVFHVIDERIFQTAELFLPEDSIDEEGPLSTVEMYEASRTADTAEKLEEDVREKLSAIERELTESGLEVRTRIEIGIPLRQILKVETTEDISLIVLGSHGKSNLEEMLLGSVSEKLVRRCKRPVLVIKR